MFGEGIFVMLDSEGPHPSLTGDSVAAWEKVLQSHDLYPESLFRFQRRYLELNPVFVWWHTLSHLLIRAISLDSGYSGTSIRERVYLDINHALTRGGIILYTVQQGADGTLGGMLSLVPKFDSLLKLAAEQMHSCSNDPLCFEQKVKAGSYAGSSCYACLLLSETSCEHRNMCLDRKLLMET